ncbi:hypothetical protein CH375_23025, partial [Leptospira ellisii]
MELSEIFAHKDGMTITKKIRIDTLFRKYKWEEEPNDSKVFRHKFLSNLRAKIKDKETVFFSVNGKFLKRVKP